MNPRKPPRFLPSGDSAILVELGEGIDPEENRRVHRLDCALRETAPEGLLDLVPAYRSLLVLFDPLVISRSRLQALVERLAASDREQETGPRRIVRVPTCYGGDYGPDLDFVASFSGLTPAEVVEIHTSSTYLVYMMGFSPGFAYLGGLSPRIASPRLDTPRTSIPAGSVGIAQQQTGIYPVESPGGWRLIGRTPIRLFEASREPPVALEPGDSIRFVAIDEASYSKTSREVAEGTYRLEVD